MSDTLKKIRTAFMAARKARDNETSSFLGTIIGKIESGAVMGIDGTKTVSEDQTIAALKQFEKGNTELLNIVPDNGKALKEKTIILEFLPSQMTETELRQILGALPTTILGEMMKHLKDNYSGRYDGKEASRIAKELSA